MNWGNNNHNGTKDEEQKKKEKKKRTVRQNKEMEHVSRCENKKNCNHLCIAIVRAMPDAYARASGAWAWANDEKYI